MILVLLLSRWKKHRFGSRTGMSLIELLVVVILIGVLASIAMVVMDPRPAAFLAAMRSDMRNLITAQEVYWAQHGYYATSAAELDFNTSEHSLLVLVGDSVSWSGRVQHEIRTDYRCSVFLGPASPIFAPAKEEGVIECLPKLATGHSRLKGKDNTPK